MMPPANPVTVKATTANLQLKSGFLMLTRPVALRRNVCPANKLSPTCPPRNVYAAEG
jgi:hypothetical protein